jgi:hypothetical protein
VLGVCAAPATTHTPGWKRARWLGGVPNGPITFCTAGAGGPVFIHCCRCHFWLLVAAGKALPYDTGRRNNSELELRCRCHTRLLTNHQGCDTDCTAVLCPAVLARWLCSTESCWRLRWRAALASMIVRRIASAPALKPVGPIGELFDRNACPIASQTEGVRKEEKESK